MSEDAAARAAQAAEDILSGDEEGKGKGPTPRDQLIALADDAVLWHDPDGEAYATIPVSMHEENIKVRSRAFRTWITRNYYRCTGKAPGRQAKEEAIDVLEAKAQFDGECHQPFVRVAEYDGGLYLDLCNAEWQAVAVNAGGWRIVGNPPVKFIRARGMRPLPAPVRGGAIEDLRPLVNVGGDDEFRLIVVWLIAALQPRGPYLVLDINGEQGSAKSTLERLLRDLIDPNSAPIRSSPRNEHDLAITARNGWIIALDNLPHVRPWLSDALCRLSTGGGFAVRKLYSDADEVLFDAQRPVILNGIPDLATRPDLADRKLSFTLPPIPDKRRKSEAEFWREFEAVHGKLLGALLDVAVGVAGQTGSVILQEKPRMADFALLGTAVETACGWPRGSFMDAYRVNLATAVEATLEANVVASTIRKLMNGRLPWSGTATELLALLNTTVENDVKSQKNWPKNASSLSGKLTRAAPSLRKSGVGVDSHRQTGKGRIKIITLTDEGQARKTPSAPSAPSDNATNSLKTNNSKADALSDAVDAAADNAVHPKPLKNNGADAADAADALLQQNSYPPEDDDIEREAITNEANFDASLDQPDGPADDGTETWTG